MSTRKHQPIPTKAISRPPIAGPTSTPTCMPRPVSALAATSSPWATVRGISASRDGRCSADAADRNAETTNSTHTCGWPANALTASTAVNPACATPVPIRRRRRSTWSASAPPYRPKTTSGTSSTSPISPTARLEPVSA